MDPRLPLLLLLGGAVLISGCTQAPTQAPVAPSTPRATTVPITPSAPAATPAPVQALGESILKCAPGTPWEFKGAAGYAGGGYKTTYTIEGKTQFKGEEYCKVKIKAEAAGAPGALQGISYEYYFQVDPAGSAYSDVWFVVNAPGQPPQETHVVGGTVTSGAPAATAAPTPPSGTPAVPIPSIAIPPGTTVSGKPPGECEKLLKPEEGEAAWVGMGRFPGADSPWYFKRVERTAKNPEVILSQTDDPNHVVLGGVPFLPVGSVSALQCSYGGGGGTDFTYTVLTFPSPGSASVTGRRLGAVVKDPNRGDIEIISGLSFLCQNLQETSEFGGPTCHMTTVRERRFIKGAKLASVTCGDCTQTQLDSLAKTIAGRL